jgi:hypothetical protein
MTIIPNSMIVFAHRALAVRILKLAQFCGYICAFGLKVWPVCAAAPQPEQPYVDPARIFPLDFDYGRTKWT